MASVWMSCGPDGPWTPGRYAVDCDSAGMCLVPAGPFMMGCNEFPDVWCETDEFPYHAVDLPAFRIDRTEVTREAYSACVDAGGCSLPEWNVDLTAAPHNPVDAVSREQAAAYCAWAGKRLPTEAEWEKAARGTDERIWPWGDREPDCGIVIMWDGHDDRCDAAGPHDVCSRSPQGDSPYGLCDMAGNVAEMVADWYGWGYYAESPPLDPPGPSAGELIVVRGGSWGGSYYDFRTAARDELLAGEGVTGIGFRCAADAE